MAIFFNQRKTRGFNYVPRFYDPDAEAREERKKIVLGEKYRSPEELKRQAAVDAGETPRSAPDYVPGSYLRQHVAARRGAGAADVMRKRRRKTQSIPMLIAIAVLIGLVIWMWYFK